MHPALGYIRVAAAAPRLHVGAVRRNAAAVLELARQAEARGAVLAVFPELCLTAYTCGDLFHQSALLDAAEQGLDQVRRASAELSCLLTVGLPVRHEGRLFNCAAVVQGGRILGVVPKQYLPAYNEYYEPRWFSPADSATLETVRLCGESVPFGADLLFESEETPEFAFGLELCEDLWAPIPPSSRLALGGALLLLNPSVSNELVAKAEYRRELVRQQSARCLAAYIYVSAGFGESTTDLVFGGHTLIAESGVLLAEGPRFQTGPSLTVTDVDAAFLLHERRHNMTFSAAVGHELRSSGSSPNASGQLRRVPFSGPAGDARPADLLRRVNPCPFVPADPEKRRERCEEIFSIQSIGLATRLAHTGGKKVLIGLSGGLDSTLALLVAVEAFRRLDLEISGIHAVTMPGFGTTDRTRRNVDRLCACLAVRLEEVDIRPVCRRHFRDIGHDGKTPDIAFENVQARERTQVLMDKANMLGALVVGTGDLSELALGWCTYNGDHMSMYAVNAGVPKTLVRYLIEYVADRRVHEARDVLRDILDTPISPELLPPDSKGEIAQKTEDTLGPYELHDFFLYQTVRRGAPPDKILALACRAFEDRYDRAAIRGWLAVFLRRFFAQQFKRSCLPDGPKVGSVALSPRGDWRMPSDALPDEWLERLPPT
ncbi:MAG: NAD(+) synthase [Kiritimatiellaeota bacterium]|nr:NAD(+) synthase [Kiritimatiellota bacterium]